MQRDAVDEVPRVLPHLVGTADVYLADDAAGAGVLDKSLHQSTSKLLGEDAPTAQNAIGVGCQMNCSASLIGEF